MARYRILFVCSGNICRSPTADGVARHWVDKLGLGGEVEIDSAGVLGYHAGEKPDPRSCEAAAKRGYDLSRLRARKLVSSDYQRFDLLVAMDDGHLEHMQRQCPAQFSGKLRRFMDYAARHGLREVPDPYYGGEAGFEVVLDMIEDGVQGLLRTLANSR